MATVSAALPESIINGGLIICSTKEHLDTAPLGLSVDGFET